MKVADFHYDLPRGLIAQEPLSPRDASRLMVVHRETGEFEHRCFRELPALLRAGDLLVLNDTRVIPARVFGRKESGAKVELLFTGREAGASGNCWRCIGRPGRALKPGAKIILDGQVSATVAAVAKNGEYLLNVHGADDLPEWLRAHGWTPLPPYINRPPGAPASEQDRASYQTIYARRDGAVAAPTAGLHFTKQLLAELQAKGVKQCAVTLHVGPGTFLPLRLATVENNQLHQEPYQIDPAAAALCNQTKAAGGRVVAVGTTAVRALETAAREGLVQAGEGSTELFIYPGYRFQAVDAMVTNFHLPESSLLLLVSAFAGAELIRRAYAEAIQRRYRFYSYGDAMVLL